MTFQPLFSEINPLYAARKDGSNVARIRIQMSEAIAPTVLRRAVDATMTRYPYFAVQLMKEGSRVYFEENKRPVVISNNPHGVKLNSGESNDHLIAFSWFEDWLRLDFAHALTDGTGIYALIRTLLYLYCGERYGAVLDQKGIRLPGDVIPPEELDDPAAWLEDIPPKDSGEPLPCLNLIEVAHLEKDTRKTVTGIIISESEFMRFNQDHDGSPATMTALLLSRAIAELCPDAVQPIRISLCVNQRKALGAPLAHQSLVGGAWLEYKPMMRQWPLARQATAYRGMVFAQTLDECVLDGLRAINRNTRTLLALETDRERVKEASCASQWLRRMLTATVSYVGKINGGGSERYIRAFHTWAHAMNESILVEISAVNGQFTLDFIQNFSNQVYLNAFLKQLDEAGIHYVRQPTAALDIPGICLPWEML